MQIIVSQNKKKYCQKNQPVELRKSQTQAEEFLWEILRNRQFMKLKFRRQHQIGDYIVDFYCHDKRLVIEIDGGIHNKQYQIKKDKKRDVYLTSLGITVLRFTNEQVINNIENVLQEISEYCLPSPSGRREGDEGEQHRGRGCDTVLFIDARKIYHQIDRAHLNRV